MFADDKSLTVNGESSLDIENGELGMEIKKVKIWLDAIKLSLNETKTQRY